MRMLKGSLMLAAAVGLWACGNFASPEGPLSVSADREELKKNSAITTPAITPVAATATTISLEVCAPAGGTGLPAGFSVQWMPAADYDPTLGWPEYTGTEFCKASFSGNANASRFPLAAGECTIVEIGNLFDEEPGVSFTCNDDLLCGTEYLFRAFGHATSKLFRSDFTSPVSGETLACTPSGGCTYTQGFWKTHGPIPTGNNVNEWPVTSLRLGDVEYTDLELQAILDTPAQGNGLLALAHQLIAAKLNVANGADGSSIAAAVAAADALIGSLIAPPLGTGWLSPSVTSALTGELGDYNEGGTGPGHCQ